MTFDTEQIYPLDSPQARHAIYTGRKGIKFLSHDGNRVFEVHKQTRSKNPTIDFKVIGYKNKQGELVFFPSNKRVRN